MEAFCTLEERKTRHTLDTYVFESFWLIDLLIID